MSRKKLYILHTMDEYELPIAVVDSLDELEALTGVAKLSIASEISHEKSHGWKCRYKRVIVDDDDD